MGKPLKIELIGDLFQLLWLESVITEASLMTRNIKLHSLFMNWMCFPLQVWGGFATPSQKPGGLGGSAPQPKIFRNISKNFAKNPRDLYFTNAPLYYDNPLNTLTVSKRH